MDYPVIDGNVFRCKVTGCDGNMTLNIPSDIKLIGCPRCGAFNCRNCNAVHAGMTCKEFSDRCDIKQQEINDENQPGPQADLTQALQQIHI